MHLHAYRHLEQLYNVICGPSFSIKWQDHVSNEVCYLDQMYPELNSTFNFQLGWGGHVALEDTSMPKAVLFGELSTGKRD